MMPNIKYSMPEKKRQESASDIRIYLGREERARKLTCGISML
jgi:hypothetical protein